MVIEPTTDVDFTGTYEATGWILDQYGERIPDPMIEYHTAPDRYGYLTTDDKGFWNIKGLSGVTTIEIYNCPDLITITGPAFDLLCTMDIFDLSGYVHNNLGDGMKGEEIEFYFYYGPNLIYATAFTDHDGYWSQENLYGKNYVRVSPLSTYDIEPVEYIVSAKEAPDEVNFIATYHISGHTRTPAGYPIGHVIMHFEGREPYSSVMTNEEFGYYRKGGLSGSVKVTPVCSEHIFDPPHAIVTERTFNVNFIGNRIY